MTSWTPDLSHRDGPRYRAIADAMAAGLQNGELKPGDRLPTHRDLAYRLGVTVGTVTRAYAEAQRRGLLEGHVGRGSF
ncbi:MAG: GntR family transcriptional regulator, partial [Dongiales bacterium]